ncbi:hypothetical protein BT93_F3075 [Corymbia citriodora subsp. variegata]|nr:hypothetical protein BT93_F3075 [Corymbia citriodora subsp. variegata]
MGSSSMAVRCVLVGIFVVTILLMSSPEVVSTLPNPNLGRKFLAVDAQDYPSGEATAYLTGRGGYSSPP